MPIEFSNVRSGYCRINNSSTIRYVSFINVQCIIEWLDTFGCRNEKYCRGRGFDEFFLAESILRFWKHPRTCAARILQRQSKITVLNAVNRPIPLAK